MELFYLKKAIAIACILPMVVNANRCSERNEYTNADYLADEEARVSAILETTDEFIMEIFKRYYDDANYSAKELIDKCLFLVKNDEDTANEIINRLISSGTFNFKEHALARISELPNIEDMSDDDIRAALAEFGFTEAEINYAISNFHAN